MQGYRDNCDFVMDNVYLKVNLKSPLAQRPARFLTGKVPGEHRRIVELKILKETRFFPCLNDVSNSVIGICDVGQKIRPSFNNS